MSLSTLKSTATATTPNFETLPVELRIRILEFSKHKSRLNLRLVSKNMCALVNGIMSMVKPSGILCDEDDGDTNSLDLLRNMTFTSLDTLEIEDFEQDLNFFSARQKDIPPADHLIIGSGISRANIAKLLRFYCAQVRSLRLDRSCFDRIRRTDLSKFYFLDKLEVLDIVANAKVDPFVHNPNDPEPGYWLSSHVLALTKFLNSVESPKINKLVWSFLWSCSKHPTDTTDFAQNSIPFWKAMEVFLQRHGKLLKCVKVYQQQLSHIDIIDFAEYFENLEKLVLVEDWFERPKYASPFAHFDEGFSKLTRLKYLTIDIGVTTLENAGDDYDTDSIMEVIFKHCAGQLESFKVRTQSNSLSWLYSHRADNLKYLELTTKTSSLARLPQNGFMMCKLAKLKLLLHIDDNSRLGDKWGEHVADWIVAVTPSVQVVELVSVHKCRQEIRSSSNLYIDVPSFCTLSRMKYLTEIGLLVPRVQVRPSNNAVEAYCSDTHGFKWCWQTNYYKSKKDKFKLSPFSGYKIKIKRWNVRREDFKPIKAMVF